MILLKLFAAFVLAGICVIFFFAVINDFRYRNSMVYPWRQLGLGAAICVLCGAGAYYLY
jgi:uncharacterized membrane protein YphA (DoxX/SURF4 family)